MSTKKSDSAIKVQVRITISNVTSDLNFESALGAEQIQSAVNAALKLSLIHISEPTRPY